MRSELNRLSEAEKVACEIYKPKLSLNEEKEIMDEAMTRDWKGKEKEFIIKLSGVKYLEINKIETEIRDLVAELQRTINQMKISYEQ